MNYIFRTLVFAVIIGVFMAFGYTETKTVKCMVQMVNYSGQGAYVIASLINPDGEYEKTLQVFGDDPEWYGELTNWWGFKKNNDEKIDAITGETLKGGDRDVIVLKIPGDKIDTGYKLRFETAVENKNYFGRDLELDVTTTNLKGQHEGSGYIRYIKLMMP